MLDQQHTKGSRFIGRQARVETKNRRRFEGKIMCIDYKGNLILHEAIAEIPPEQNCPLNYQLCNYADSRLTFTPPESFTEEQKQ
jgi:small nuclear ribonucleoprotein (snRNP)-like protein